MAIHNNISKYLSLVKFNHTIFALPFAMTAYVYALTSTGTPFEWLLLVEILFCMVFARNTAMGFNRWADRNIDAQNPRTASREIPSGRISPGAALAFTIANAVGFIIVAGFINKLTLILSPLALFIITGYSFTKRFTAWSHIVLGVCLSIAPIGTYIAVTGTLAMFPILLGCVVVTWVAGFDILYSFQDADHDRSHNLHSIPAQFSPKRAKAISIFLHLITVYVVLLAGLNYGGGILYWIGASVFTLICVVEHIIFTPASTGRIAAIFGLVNGCSSFALAAFTIADMLCCSGL